MNRQVTKGIVLKYMREALKKYNCNPHITLINETLIKLVEANIIDPPPKDKMSNLYNHISVANPDLEKLLVECYTYLIIQGIIIPKPVTPNYGSHEAWSAFRTTEYGEEWANSEKEPIPEDVDGFVKYMRETIQDLDDVVIQYVSEALSTFNGKYFFASAVMLGAAAEKMIYLLSDAIKNSATKPKLKSDITEALEYRRLKTLFDLMSKILNGLIEQKIIPYSIHEGSNHYLSSLFDTIRIQRNYAVHPVVGKVTKLQPRLLLLSFPHACKKGYDFLNWLKENNI